MPSSVPKLLLVIVPGIHHYCLNPCALKAFQPPPAPSGDPAAVGTLSSVFLTRPPFSPWLQLNFLKQFYPVQSCPVVFHCPQVKAPLLIIIFQAFHGLETSGTLLAEHLAHSRHSANTHFHLLPSVTHRQRVGHFCKRHGPQRRSSLLHPQHWAWHTVGTH